MILERDGPAQVSFFGGLDSTYRFASFGRIRHRHHDADVFLYAFDLIELDGDDLRRHPLNVRKAPGRTFFSGGVAVCAAQARSQCLRRSASNCASKRATSRRSLLLVSRRK
jgi:hypothetical protein